MHPSVDVKIVMAPKRPVARQESWRTAAASDSKCSLV